MKRDHLIKPFLNEDYPVIDYGNGVFLYDKEGKEYLDGSSGAVTANIGHNVTEIRDVMHEQAKKISFVYRSQFTSEPAEELAKKISELTPSNQLNWSFFVNSGSEATETAIKIAVQYWQEKGKPQKYKVLSRWMSYHGITLGALSISGHLARRERFNPLLDPLPILSPPYCYRCSYDKTFPDCQLFCANQLETAILEHGPNTVAAFIAEPIIGAAGAAIVPPEGYYEKIKEICDRYSILFIADEVMTGFGRTGQMFGIEHWDVSPDMLVVGKGLSGGYTPIAATIVSDALIEPIKQGSGLIMSGHTFSANPQSCATALAVIDYLQKHQIVQGVLGKGNYLLGKLKEVEKRFSFICDTRGKGLLLGIEFETEKHDPSFTKKMIEKTMVEGLLVYPASAGKLGLNGHAIIIAPPLTITLEEIDELVNRFTNACLKLEGEITS
ncbi:aspartate aminotransferase family protein [Bacillus sp. FJAT-45350]|uniref:aspartate aminotransferase family protein n=1 Tax=Bacillus sp. FJAT-45350 TaxID=2011014 RepID=UPI000BB83B36|nr:aspartate aminotransferase family protein [Bacillus sp. FJAT-45350]